MNLSEYKNVWVFIETEHGKAKQSGYELLSAGRQLADKSGEELFAIVIGCRVRDAAMQAAGYGADRVILVDSSEYESYSTDAYTACVTVLVDKYKPSVFLLGATNNGRDLGPRVACRLKTGLTADCTSLDIDEESKNVAWTRPAFGGNLMATILCPEHRPQMGTVRPGVFKKPVFKAAGNIPEPSNYLIEEEIRIPENMIRTKLVEQIHEAAQAVSLTLKLLFQAAAESENRKTSPISAIWQMSWAEQSDPPEPVWMPVGSPMPIRSDRPARR